MSLLAGAITTSTPSFIIGVEIAPVQAWRNSELTTVVAWPGKLHRPRVSVLITTRRANKNLIK